MKIDKNLQDAIMDACTSDASKIINYLNEQELRSKKRNVVTLCFTVVGAVGSIIAAVCGIITLIH